MIWRQQISALSITKLGRGLGRKLQVETSRPAATSTRNLQSWIQDMGYLNPQRPRIIMVATSGCPILLVHSKFGGRSVWWLKSTKDVSVDTNTGSVTFIGWGTFVPEIRHCYYMDIHASLHLLYLHFFEEGQSASKKHRSSEHLKKVKIDKPEWIHTPLSLTREGFNCVRHYCCQ